ncbi:hypothetical protein BOX15_Mlig026097g1, partial [Macrostomum lignano]
QFLATPSGSQTEARQTSSAMPASDSEPQRQVVYEPCVRPSELLRRQRLPTEASAEQPTGCWPATRQFVVGLAPQSVASVPKLPQSPPSPSAISAASAASRLLQQQRRRQPPARLSWPCGCGCRACSHRCLLRPSRHPLRRRRDQRRRQEALCGSGLAGPAASPEAGFYNGFRVAGELLLLLLSVPLLLLLLHCLLLLSGIGGQPALLQADWLQFLKFFEGLV